MGGGRIIVTLINFTIWILFLLATIFLVYLIYFLVNKRKRKLFRTGMLLLIVVIFLGIFYAPTQTHIDTSKNYSITFYTGNTSFAITDKKQVSRVISLVNSQTLIRNTEKTIFGVTRLPSDDTITIRIVGINVPYHDLFVVRKDDYKQSFANINEQYYSILSAKSFVKEVVNLVSDYAQ
ncbi:hypothetical protein GH741_11220 [Aquibacillus halophilus]|uniref:Uncharacterized protein n=1 Tax=Aquibacillus halophilus TaxID=930132 RepID=A0A6A8DDD1_9BACI|nr:hypothetical protein [Aquibacillus halophilus]MRH43250.1 hypothetical protein [Aquibacillus halophilus]